MPKPSSKVIKTMERITQPPHRMPWYFSHLVPRPLRVFITALDTVIGSIRLLFLLA